MRKTAFSQLMWGFLFILFSFRVMGVDLLPDIVGFILLFVGLGTLARDHKAFAAARFVTIPLAILSLLDIYQPTSKGLAMQFGTVAAIILYVVTVVLSLVLVYQICHGTAALAEAATKEELAATARKRWVHYVVFQVLMVLSLLLALGGVNGPLGFFAFFVFILAIIYTILVIIFLMNLMWQAARDL